MKFDCAGRGTICCVDPISSLSEDGMEVKKFTLCSMYGNMKNVVHKNMLGHAPQCVCS